MTRSHHARPAVQPEPPYACPGRNAADFYAAWRTNTPAIPDMMDLEDQQCQICGRPIQSGETAFFLNQSEPSPPLMCHTCGEAWNRCLGHSPDSFIRGTPPYGGGSCGSEIIS